MIDGSRVLLEYNNALRDTQNTAREYGNPIVVWVRGEADVNRDEYGGIKSRDLGQQITMSTSTIDYEPSKYKLEKAGLRSACDVMIVTAMKDWIDEGLAFDDLEIKRMTVRISAAPGEANGTLYDVREKSRVNKFANGYLGISMGLSRR